MAAKMREIIAAEIEVNQRCTPRQHFCKFPCPGFSNLIVAEIEVSNPSTLYQQFCKPIHSLTFKLLTPNLPILAIPQSKVMQYLSSFSSNLIVHCYKKPCFVVTHVTVVKV